MLRAPLFLKFQRVGYAVSVDGRPTLPRRPTIDFNGMSESDGENPRPDSEAKESVENDSKQAIRKNLSNFLNPGFPIPKKAAPDPNGALQLRMAQMELANRMRLSQGKDQNQSPKSVPMNRNPPPGGFGSAQGVFHMKAGNFGQRKPTASKLSPYQQIFANASKSTDEAQESGENEAKKSNNEPEILEVPTDAEVKQNQKPKRPRGKKFRNPSL
jgi:hypothetical protein